MLACAEIEEFMLTKILIDLQDDVNMYTRISREVPKNEYQIPLKNFIAECEF